MFGVSYAMAAAEYPMAAASGFLSGHGAGGSAFAAPPKIRKEFPETWIWDTITAVDRWDIIEVNYIS